MVIRWLLVGFGLAGFVGYGMFAKQGQIAEAPLLPMTFAHADHIEQACITCHHNYVDDNDLRSCLDCHKNDPEVSHLIEPMFHELCMGCHLEKVEMNEASGPTRQCQGCHVADEHP